jgi:hemolysin III
MLALLGIVSKLTIGFRLPHFSTALYLLMGWLIVIAIKPLVETIPRAGLFWLAAGGLAYTGGVVFYNMKHVRYAHGIWHLCVAAGSVCHFIAVLHYAIKA